MSRVLMVLVATGCLFSASMAKADPVGGKVDKTFIVQVGGILKHTLTLNGGERTQIRVTGDGSTRLTMQVSDALGNLVISDSVGAGDQRGVWVLPLMTGKFTIKVMNHGNESNGYQLQID